MCHPRESRGLSQDSRLRGNGNPISHRLRDYFFAISSLLLVASCSHDKARLLTPAEAFSSPPVYNYPIGNPYAATIIGTPKEMQVDYSSQPLPVVRTLTMFKDRRIPEGLWYENGLRYSVLLQKKPAALVYVIAGTGADCASPDMITIAEMLYSAGFSTVLLSSPTDPNFIVNASSNFIPGRPSQDAHDLYEVMKRLDPEITAESHATGHMLIGYSLGALDALFTARLDSEENALHFGKTLLINPPLNLYSSIKTLDRMFYKALPHGVDDADNFVKKTVKRLSSLKQSNDALDFGNEKLLLDAYNKYKPNDRQLQTIIGMSFRLAATNMIFVSDVMGHHGYVFPKNEEFTTGTHLNHYFAVTLRVRFQDYFNELYAHYYLAANPGLTKQALIDEDDVAGFAPFIKTHNIGVVTNADDIILAPGEYDRLVRLFGSKAITFPTGGHLGNLGYPAVAYRIIEFMKQ